MLMLMLMLMLVLELELELELMLMLELVLRVRPRLLGRRRGRRHVATELAGGGQRRSALGARMAGLCGIVADGVRRAVVGRVGDASLVRGIGWAGDAMRGCGCGWRRRRSVRRWRELRSRCRSAVVVVMVGVESWRPSWIHSAEVLAGLARKLRPGLAERCSGDQSG